MHNVMTCSIASLCPLAYKHIFCAAQFVWLHNRAWCIWCFDPGFCSTQNCPCNKNKNHLQRMGNLPHPGGWCNYHMDLPLPKRMSCLSCTCGPWLPCRVPTHPSLKLGRSAEDFLQVLSQDHQCNVTWSEKCQQRWQKLNSCGLCTSQKKTRCHEQLAVHAFVLVVFPRTKQMILLLFLFSCVTAHVALWKNTPNLNGANPTIKMVWSFYCTLWPHNGKIRLGNTKAWLILFVANQMWKSSGARIRECWLQREKDPMPDDSHNGQHFQLLTQCLKW